MDLGAIENIDFLVVLGLLFEEEIRREVANAWEYSTSFHAGFPCRLDVWDEAIRVVLVKKYNFKYDDKTTSLAYDITDMLVDLKVLIPVQVGHQPPTEHMISKEMMDIINKTGSAFTNLYER